MRRNRKLCTRGAAAGRHWELERKLMQACQAAAPWGGAADRDRTGGKRPTSPASRPLQRRRPPTDDERSCWSLLAYKANVEKHVRYVCFVCM